MKKTILMIVVAVVIAGISGEGVYLWQNKKLEQEKSALSKEVIDNSQAKSPITTNNNAEDVSFPDLGITTENGVAMHKAYTDTIEGYANVTEENYTSRAFASFTVQKSQTKVDQVVFDFNKNTAPDSFGFTISGPNGENRAVLGCLGKQITPGPQFELNSEIGLLNEMEVGYEKVTEQIVDEDMKMSFYKENDPNMDHSYIKITTADLKKITNSNANNKVKIKIHYYRNAVSETGETPTCVQNPNHPITSIKVL